MCLDQSAGASTSESIHLLISNKKYMSNNNLKGKLKSQLTSNIHTQSSMNLTLFYNVIFKIDQCQPCRRSKKICLQSLSSLWRICLEKKTLKWNRRNSPCNTLKLSSEALCKTFITRISTVTYRSFIYSMKVSFMRDHVDEWKTLENHSHDYYENSDN